MLSTLDISTSGLVAQRQWMNTIAANIANVRSTRDEDGNVSPFQRRYVTFTAQEASKQKNGAAGVALEIHVDTESEPRLEHLPNHPDANADGKVAFPNINMINEFTNAMLASRAYEANIAAIEMTKQMASTGMRILG